MRVVQRNGIITTVLTYLLIKFRSMLKSICITLLFSVRFPSKRFLLEC